jgi:hypothetical protein
MEVTRASSLKDADADIFMYTEPPSVEYLLEQHGVNPKIGSNGARGKEVPLIIVCLNASEAISITANHIKVCQLRIANKPVLTVGVDAIGSWSHS